MKLRNGDRLAAVWACAFSCALLALPRAAVADAPVPLSYFEQRVGASPALGAAAAFVEQRTAMLQEARDKSGTQAFGSNFLGPRHEIITSTTQRSFFRYEQQVGLRFPVLGARELQQQDILGVSTDERLARLTYDETRLQLLGKIRANYITYWAARRAQHVAAAFVDELGTEKPAAEALRRSGFWTAADLLDYRDAIQQARLDARRAATDQDNARLALGLATNGTVAAFDPIEPPFAGCSVGAGSVLPSALAVDIELAKIGVQRDEANQLLSLQRWLGYDASFNVGLLTSLDAPGGLGYGLIVGTTVGLPLYVGRMRDDQSRFIAAQLKQYDLLEAQRRAELTADIQTAVSDRTQAYAELAQARQSERVREEDVREFLIRMRYVAPDTLSDVLTKAETAYRARAEVVSDEAAVLARINDLLQLAPTACAGRAPSEGSRPT